MDDPRAELERALALENETERKLAVAAVVNELVRPLGFRAVVIGGLAVEFWTRGDYTTADIDLYLPWTAQVDVAFASAGFIKEGRHWTVPDHGVFVEAPASALGEQEEVHEVVLAGGYVAVVLALEDVLIDRLHQFVAGGYRDVTSQAIALLGSDELNRERLEARARDEGLESALQAIRDLAREPNEMNSSRRGNSGRLRNSFSASDNQLMRRIVFRDWMARRDAARARLARIEGAFRDPYVRERPRDPEEARLLRERGTPEHLIGPERNKS